MKDRTKEWTKFWNKFRDNYRKTQPTDKRPNFEIVFDLLPEALKQFYELPEDAKINIVNEAGKWN